MTRKLASAALVVLGLAFVAAPAALADRIVTKSGRVLEGKVTKKDDNTYHIKLNTTEFDMSVESIKEVLVEGDMSGYVPKDDKEKEFLAKGLVKYNGQWISKDQYQQNLDKENAKRRKLLDEEAKHLQFATGWKFETAHFQIQGNCPKDNLDDLASLLEEYYNLMNTKIGMKASPALQRKKMGVNIYRDEEDYIRSGGAPGGTAGYFSNSQESLNLYYNFEDPGLTRHVTLHEGTHLLTYLCNPKFQPPSWINEGMAEYFASAKITGERGKRKMEPGQILDLRLLVLQDMEKTTYVPVDKWLLYSDSYNNVSQAGGSPYQHYAYWWGFCHFLMSNKKYDKKFQNYFRDLYAMQGFEKKVGYGGLDTGGVEFTVEPKEYSSKLYERLGVKDPKKLDEEFRAWIKAQEPVGARGYYYLGRDLCQQGKYDEALKNLDTAIAKGFDTSECYASRASAWFAKHQIEKAVQDLKKAIEQNPTEPSYRRELALFLRTRKETRAEGIQQLRIAFELDPYDPSLEAEIKRLEKGEDGDK
jgi:tetratricopeptide (TPR) repeat protein